MKQLSSKAIALSLIVGFGLISGCKPKKDQASVTVQPGTLADNSAYAAFIAAKKQKVSPDTAPPEETKPEEKPEEVKPPTPVTPEEKKPDVTSPVNPYKDNATMKSVFEAFDKANLQGSTFTGKDMVADLAEANQDAEKTKVLLTNLFSILENKEEALSKELPVNTRMRYVFDLCGTSPAFETALEERLKDKKIVLPENLTDQDKKMARAFLYATELYHLFYAQPTEGAGFNIYNSAGADGKNYHVAILGRIDFTQGVKKKSLTKDDISNLDALMDFWNSYVSSAMATQECNFLVVGNADRTGKSSSNKKTGKTRADMVLKEMKKLIYPDIFTSDSWGDEMALKADPKDAANRRVELVLYKTEVK